MAYYKDRLEVYRPDHSVISTLGTPDYVGTMRSVKDKHSRENTVDGILSRGAWLDTFIAHYADWDRYTLAHNHHTRWFVRRMNVWDLKDKFIVGLGMDTANYVSKPEDIRTIDYLRVRRSWCYYFNMDKKVIFHVRRKARKEWKTNLHGILDNKPNNIGAGSKGCVTDFHVGMVNIQLDEEQAPYRVHTVPGTALAVVRPLGLDYLVNQHTFTELDCFAPIFMGKREATTTKQIISAPCSPRRCMPDHDHVLYFQLT